MSTIRYMIEALGEELSAEDNAASDLWTWLPSYAVAQRHHGDYGSSVAPSVKDVLREAAKYIAHLRNPDEPLSEEDREWFETCPCGEPHDEALGEQDPR